MPLHTIPPQTADEEILNNLLQEGIDRKRGEEQLFSKYAYFIQQAMHKYSFQEEDAFTIYADTIISAIPKIVDGSFQRRSSLKTWLYQIFHNKCVDLVRKNATNKRSVNRTTSISDIFLNLADSARSVVQEMMDRTDRDLIKQRLNEIGENCRQILSQWAEGFSDKEIAATLEYKTADVVKTSRLRCLDKLRQLYKVNTK
ncbi:MAG: sigma-70 family polymerase sigma factor [Chitinophagaceae bacterium]|nr:sigma-70 family polymerase sigma factor [Chitinophagaceae bacterium]